MNLSWKRINVHSELVSFFFVQRWHVLTLLLQLFLPFSKQKAATRQLVRLCNDFGCAVAKEDVAKICHIKKNIL